ncbi:MAG: prolipoprotein diacylglyceryl transferase [Dehalococcoidales bacterium]|jgi:phosphatidylglycerol:prolipoprotein diacylglycerol transferase|nr:prolipoprotein diacylglyceryl transferase [Dehalococcoidales bacterium]MDD5122930.1 prolipoprotein diacylglyceryl transferase [Dehalococcoidales bacterium]MDD5498577.1 prolipoprotein diacylglyceryl transferase [Dehalococcoidales bacterium]
MLLSSSFNIGPITIQFYGIFISLGILFALLYAFYEAHRRGENLDHVVNMALVVIPLGIIGARLYHVIDYWSYYSQNLIEIIGGRGLGIYGAIIGGAIGVLLYCAWKKLSPLRWMDIIAPGLILAQAIGRWGNFFNQELYGYPTDLPWGIYIEPGNRIPGFETYTHFHPLFLYESLWNLLGFAILFFVNRKYGKKLLDGEVTIAYFMYYSVGRFILEGMKIDVWTIAGFPTARWISIITFIVCLGIIIYRRRKLRTIAQ